MNPSVPSSPGNVSRFTRIPFKMFELLKTASTAEVRTNRSSVPNDGTVGVPLTEQEPEQKPNIGIGIGPVYATASRLTCGGTVVARNNFRYSKGN